MINIEITMRLVDGQLMAPYQHEVENLALETIGDQDVIYFDKIYISEELYLLYDRIHKAWIVRVEHKK